jgi:hypothetical protein
MTIFEGNFAKKNKIISFDFIKPTITTYSIADVLDTIPNINEPKKLKDH